MTPKVSTGICSRSSHVCWSNVPQNARAGSLNLEQVLDVNHPLSINSDEVFVGCEGHTFWETCVSAVSGTRRISVVCGRNGRPTAWVLLALLCPFCEGIGIPLQK